MCAHICTVSLIKVVKSSYSLSLAIFVQTQKKMARRTTNSILLNKGVILQIEAYFKDPLKSYFLGSLKKLKKKRAKSR